MSSKKGGRVLISPTSSGCGFNRGCALWKGLWKLQQSVQLSASIFFNGERCLQNKTNSCNEVARKDSVDSPGGSQSLGGLASASPLPGPFPNVTLDKPIRCRLVPHLYNGRCSRFYKTAWCDQRRPEPEWEEARGPMSSLSGRPNRQAFKQQRGQLAVQRSQESVV